VGIFLRVLVAVAAFAVSGVGFRLVASPSGGGLVGAKREFWRDQRQPFDTVFLGSSHVYRGIVPREFDRQLGSARFASRSFNYGVQLPSLLECRYLIRELISGSQGLKRIFFEYQTLTPQIDPQNAFQPRTLYWHDLASTRSSVERALYWGDRLGDDFEIVEEAAQGRSVFALLDGVLAAPWRVANIHVQHYLVDAMFVGRSKDFARGLLGRQHGQARRFQDGGGYISLEEENRWLSEQGQPDNPYSRRSNHFLAHLNEFWADVQALRTLPKVFEDEEWMNSELTQVHDLELLEAIAREVTEAGIEFVLVVLPQQSADRKIEEQLAERLGVPVLRYNRPGRYPELYEPKMRFDSGHLSAEGALWFTRQLARDYVSFSKQVRG
jgi:hypothetical protein